MANTLEENFWQAGRSKATGNRSKNPLNFAILKNMVSLPTFIIIRIFIKDLLGKFTQKHP